MCNYLSGLIIPTDQGMIVRTCKNMTHHEDCYKENKITPEMVSYEFEWTSAGKSSLEIRFPDEMSANRQRQIKKWLTDQYKTRSKLECYLLSTLDFSKDDTVYLRSLAAIPEGFSLPNAEYVYLSSGRKYL